jgi:hypothetical protein
MNTKPFGRRRLPEAQDAPTPPRSPRGPAQVGTLIVIGAVLLAAAHFWGPALVKLLVLP